MYRRKITKTVQIVLDKELMQAIDRVARRTRRNRSEVVRDALREHVCREEIRALEERDRKGYSKNPQRSSHLPNWEREAVWRAE